MDERQVKELIKRQTDLLLRVSFGLMAIIIFSMTYSILNLDFLSPPQIADAVPIEEDRNRIEDGIHLRTGLKEAEGMFLVVNNCTNCHSAKLLTQNSMTADRWNETIKWMQETQGLWDLGESQEVIVNYLVTNYPPRKSVGRRANLENIEWYAVED